MTAHGLIDDIFSRVQDGPGNERVISADQLTYLRNLIGADEEGSAFTEGKLGGFGWTPSGRHKYIVSVKDVMVKGKLKTIRKLIRLSNLAPSDEGCFF
jgi:hypothetical protein